MKLNLLFIVMDLLIMLAYPIVLVHGKLHRVSRSGQGIPPGNLLITIPAK